LFTAVLLPAQQVPPKRPKVALVLEGGGALGFAHIGVLDFLEQHHVPVDLVVGTSMGGLVGGLYALGNTPADIRNLTTEIDWSSVLAGRVAFQDLSFRRKEDRIAFPNRLEFGLKGGLKVPAGLNSGQQVGLILNRAALAYDDLLSFDNLPIPFRCVATDLTMGQETVFDRGSVSDALRATMSIPAIFSPVTINGHLYSDGGALNNLPVDVAKKAGADIVIAVYLDTGPPVTSNYGSPLAVAGRNIQVMIAANELHNMAAADILISADVKGFAAFSFNQSSEIIPRGFAAAESKQKMLLALALNDEDWNAYTAARAAKIKRNVPVPQRVEVAGVPPKMAKDIQAELAPYLNKPLQTKELEKSLAQLTGNGILGTAGYSIGVGADGVPELQVKASPKPYGPPFMNLGVNIDGSNPENVLFGLGARFTWMNIGGDRAEWRNDAFFGSTYGVRSEYYRPLSGASKFFVAPRAYAINDPFDLFFGQSRIAQYRIQREGFGGDAGYALNRRAEIRVGQDLFLMQVRKRITEDTYPDSSEREWQSSLRFHYYGLDNIVVPRSGFQIEASSSWYSRQKPNVSFAQSEFRASYFKPVSNPGSLMFTANGGTTYGAKTLNLELQSFALGGPLRLGAYGENELLGNRYFLTQGGYLHKLATLSSIVGEGLYGLVFMEVGKVYGSPVGFVPGSFLALDGSVALVARTAIGPVFIGGSIGNDNHRKWWFGLGRVF
jgi:NTE family protein